MLHAKAFADEYKRPAEGAKSPQNDQILLKISHNLAVEMKFAAKVRKFINSTKFFETKITFII